MMYKDGKWHMQQFMHILVNQVRTFIEWRYLEEKYCYESFETPWLLPRQALPLALKYIEARTYYFKNIKGKVNNGLRETKMLPGGKTLYEVFPPLEEFFTGKEHGFNPHSHFKSVCIFAVVSGLLTLCLSCSLLRCLCGSLCAAKASKKTAEKEKAE